MTVHLSEDLTNSIRAEVLRGHFASEDEMVAAAVREYLRRKQEPEKPMDTAAVGGISGSASEQTSAQALQRRLYESGVLSEIKPPITDLMPYCHRRAVPIQGEPLSETIINDRR